MKSNQRRITLTLSAMAGGLLAAAFLPLAVASADQFDITPDTTSFDPTQVEGYPPLFHEVTGTESWNVTDLTTNSVAVPDFFKGVDTDTTFGSFTNDDFLTQNAVGVGGVIVNPGAEFDLANFGGGFANEWVDVPGSGTGSGISDLLITPFGDFELLGSFFSNL
jgi:hypothetical protein